MYSDTHGKGKASNEKVYMVDMEGAEYEGKQRKHLESILVPCAAAFARHDRDGGCTDVICHHAKITHPRPSYLSYFKAQGSSIRKEIDDQTDGMLASGIVVESESPYCSPIVMARKKNGGWRYCVDLRKINQMTEKVTFPMPRIEDALRKLKKPKYFSTLDLLKAYYQIPVAQEDQKYYAFSDGRRHLQFTRCPMGAKNSGSTLAMLMELVLRGLPPECVVGYLDDILLATEDWDSHMVLLDRLLKSLIKAKLKLCPSKCQFARKEAKALGHRLSEDGIRPDKFNLDKVKLWTVCKNVAEVRTFLGLTGYYRSLIKNYAHIAAPLSDLLHNDKVWEWGEREQEAFNQLKESLVSEPVAAYPDFDKEFLLKTDASKVALGAVLAQKQEKKERMIACMSKKFNTDELKWAPYDREFYAMVIPTRHFSHYLRWNHFKLFTDHKPLLAWKDVTTQKDASGKRTRWVMELSTYDVEVIYKEGRRHGDADALSRHPNPDEASEEEEEEVLSALSDKLPNVAAWEEQEGEDVAGMLDDEKSRIPRMAIELSKYDVQVMYREEGVNINGKETAPEAIDRENGNFICSLSTKTDIEICLLAAQTFTEIALVEIHADEELSKEMAKLQREDVDLGKVMSLVEQNVQEKAAWKSVPNWYRQNRNGFVVSKGILYHVKKIESCPEPVARAVIPKVKVKEMLFRCHGCKHSGHPGHHRAVGRIEKFAIWHGMNKDVEQHVKKCAECQAARLNVPKRVAPVQPQKAMAPLQFVQADLFKTGISSNGMNYICVFEDRYTKFCKLYPLKDAKAKGVASCIESFITQLGCPDVWGTDGGPEFYNVLIFAMCHVFSIKKEFALAHRPMTQGQTERKNRTIKAELVKRISQFGKTWPSYLKWIEMAYNCTPHSSHGYTPFLLMFGREAKIPMQISIPKIDTKGWQTTMKSYLADFLDRMAKFQKQVIVNRTLYEIRMARQHDKNVMPPLQAGDQVLRDVPRQFRSKLDLPRDGPWEVEEQREKHGKILPVYKIRNEDEKVILAHRESLTPFAEPNFSVNKSQVPIQIEEQNEPPKEGSRARKEKVRQVVSSDGPASRTRAKSKQIMSLLETIPPPIIARVASDDDDDDGGDDDGDDDDDGGGDDGGDGSDDDDSDDDGGGNEEGAEREETEQQDEPTAASASNSAEQFQPVESPSASGEDNESDEAFTPDNSLHLSEGSEVLSGFMTPNSHETTPENKLKTVLGVSVISPTDILALMSAPNSAGSTAPLIEFSPAADVFLPLNVTMSSMSDQESIYMSADNPSNIEISRENRTTEEEASMSTVGSRRSSRERKNIERYGH